MKRSAWLALALAWGVAGSGCASQAEKPSQAMSAEAAQPDAQAEEGYRKPFVLRVYVDDKHNYVVHFDKPVPYVYHDNLVFILPGESFGVNLHVERGKITSVSYQQEAAGADLAFDFRQLMKRGKFKGNMLLKIRSHAGRVVYMDALMRVPGREHLVQTHIPPVRAGKGASELWRHPIVGLALKNFRFEK